MIKFFKLVLFSFVFMVSSQALFSASSNFSRQRFALLDALQDVEDSFEFGRGIIFIRETIEQLNQLEAQLKQLCLDHWEHQELVVEERIPTELEFQNCRTVAALENVLQEYQAIVDRARAMEAVFRDLAFNVDNQEVIVKYQKAKIAHTQAGERFKLAECFFKAAKSLLKKYK